MLPSTSMSSSDGSDDSIFVFDPDAHVKRFRTDWSRSPSPPSEVDSDGHETAQEKVQEKAQEVHVKKIKRIAAAERGSKRRRIVDIPSGDEPSKPKDRAADADIPSLDRRLKVTESGVLGLQEHVIKLQNQVDALMSIDSIADTLRVKALVAAPSATADKKVLRKEAVSIVSVEASTVTTTRKRKHSVIETDEASSTNIDTVAKPASTDERTPKRPKIHRAAISTWQIILSGIASVVSPP